MAKSAKAIFKAEVEKQLLPTLEALGFKRDPTFENNGKQAKGAQDINWVYLRPEDNGRTLALIVTVTMRPQDKLLVQGMWNAPDAADQTYPLTGRVDILERPLSVLSPLDHLQLETALTRGAADTAPSLSRLICRAALIPYYGLETCVTFLALLFIAPIKGIAWILGHPSSTASGQRQAWIVRRAATYLTWHFSDHVPTYLKNRAAPGRPFP